MKSNPYTEQLKKFFLENEKDLLNNYPGLKFKRLNEELTEFNPECDELFHSFCDQLKSGKPLEYITHKAYFYKDEFYVDENVLIPRCETEILVEIAAQKTKKVFSGKQVKIIDLGTGSGAIILSYLSEIKNAEAFASDISEEALNVARKNAEFLKKEVHFLKADRLNMEEGDFDVILFNPPYIKRDSDFENVHHQVREYEPHVALFLNDAEYDEWFREFFTQLKEKLKYPGIFMMEGHEDHLENLKNLAKEMGFDNAEIIKDYGQVPRFLLIERENG
jgi:release factor glutamine methyltransferase